MFCINSRSLAPIDIDGAPVATHIGDCDSRDDAAWTNGDIMHVAAGIASPERPGMDPDPQARQICDVECPGYWPMFPRTSGGAGSASIPCCRPTSMNMSSKKNEHELRITGVRSRIQGASPHTGSLCAGAEADQGDALTMTTD